ncbi:MAG: HNH endonuclease [Thermodesulfovibrionales bacterium]|nr:HNH endonuclease [Thermodesulfovibrionales bacterium]
MPKSINELIMQYFQSHPNKDLPHGPVVDWVTKQYLKENPTPPRDPWRAIRKLHQDGILIKVSKGIYRYEPHNTKQKVIFDFSDEIKEKIFERDGYKCVVCGRGREDGVELCADHIKPKDKGGDNSIDNGQTLCMEHNLIKKNYSQTEAGKRFFIKLYQKAVKMNDKKIINFCKCVFDCYDIHGINGHITRPKIKDRKEEAK